MPLELALLTAAIPQIIQAVKVTADGIKEIRSGFGSKNEEAKNALTAKMNDLQTKLAGVGKLAKAAIAYSRTRENLNTLQAECAKIEGFLRENSDDATDWASPLYDSNWLFVRSMFDTLDASRKVPRQVLNNRAEWYDAQDRNQVEIHLGRFDEAFNEARAYLEERSAKKLLEKTNLMTRSLRDADVVLEDTIYETILDSLAQLDVE